MRVDYILATHLQCRPRSDRVKAALAEGLVVLRDVDGGEHVIRDATFQVVVGAASTSIYSVTVDTPTATSPRAFASNNASVAGRSRNRSPKRELYFVRTYVQCSSRHEGHKWFSWTFRASMAMRRAALSSFFSSTTVRATL